MHYPSKLTSGMTLIEVTIALGLVSMGMLAAMQLALLSQKIIKSAGQSSEFNVIQTRILGALNSPHCTMNTYGPLSIDPNLLQAIGASGGGIIPIPPRVQVQSIIQNSTSNGFVMQSSVSFNGVNQLNALVINGILYRAYLQPTSYWGVKTVTNTTNQSIETYYMFQGELSVEAYRPGSRGMTGSNIAGNRLPFSIFFYTDSRFNIVSQDVNKNDLPCGLVIINARPSPTPTPPYQGQIDYSNCMHSGAGPGGDNYCFSGYVLVGACSAGDIPDCGGNSFTSIHCCSLKDRSQMSTSIDPPLFGTHWGEMRICNDTLSVNEGAKVITGVCASGDHPDCWGNMTKTFCTNIPRIKLLSSACHIMCGNFGEYVTCYPNEVAVGFCASGTLNDCHNVYIDYIPAGTRYFSNLVTSTTPSPSCATQLVCCPIDQNHF